MSARPEQRAEVEARLAKADAEVDALEAEFELSPEGWEAYDDYVESWRGSSAYERAFDKWCDDNNKWDDDTEPTP